VNYRSISTLNKQIINWLPKLPQDLELIVGIPRSGMLAANILALHMNLPFTDIDGFLEGRVLATGPRFNRKQLLSDTINVLVIDDSLLSGTEMAGVKEKISMAKIPHKIYYAAVYVKPGNEHMVDYFCEILPTPRCFEWNVMHHSILQRCCVDVDGVICRDPDKDENDDGIRYRQFLSSVEPLIIPTWEIGWLVTCRLEKYRTLTEEWLHKHGIKYNELIMMDFPDKATRVASGSHGSFKAKVYESTRAKLFIESSLKQATEIARITGKDVLCMETREMINPSIAAKSLRRVKGMRYSLKRRIRRRIKSVLQQLTIIHL